MSLNFEERVTELEVSAHPSCFFLSPPSNPNRSHWAGDHSMLTRAVSRFSQALLQQRQKDLAELTGEKALIEREVRAESTSKVPFFFLSRGPKPPAPVPSRPPPIETKNEAL